MANTLFIAAISVVLALLSGVEAAQNPTYLVNYAGNPYYKKAGSFCKEWRTASVNYAGMSCHHHVISCKEVGNMQAQVFSGWVTFNNPNGCHPETGPKKMTPVDDTKIVAGMARAKLIKRIGKRDVDGEEVERLEKRTHPKGGRPHDDPFRHGKHHRHNHA